MPRITAEHLSREAWVYVRQSTPDQVRHQAMGEAVPSHGGDRVFE